MRKEGCRVLTGEHLAYRSGLDTSLAGLLKGDFLVSRSGFSSDEFLLGFGANALRIGFRLGWVATGFLPAWSKAIF